MKDWLRDILWGLFAAAAWIACLAVAVHFDEPDVQSPAQVEYTQILNRKKQEMQDLQEVRKMNEIENQRLLDVLNTEKDIGND